MDHLYKNALFILLIFILSCSNKNYYNNPILAGYYPDPSICRVNDDYYLVNSSFSHYPGVPIFHSTDLVHWQQIGFILDRPEQLNLDGLEISQGIYAPTIRYNDGVFYMITTLVGGKGNFYVTSKKPEGPWSKPIWLPEVGGIDPSFFFDDDGKVYIIHNDEPPNRISKYDGHRAIWLWDFDLEKQKVVGQPNLLIDGGIDISKKPVWIEGPHIFKKDAYYYLTAAEGGTSINHSQVILRSKNVKGPYVSYENNPILTQRDQDPLRKNPVTNIGHADFVETQNGEWWSVFLGCRPYEENFFNTGRETFMVPVIWKNDWPNMNPGSELVKYSYPVPKLTEDKNIYIPTSGNFTLREDFKKNKLDNYWTFIRTVKEKWYYIDSTSFGYLKIKLRPQSISDKSNPSFIGRRQQHSNFEVTASMNFIPENENETAGLVTFQNNQYYYYFGITKAGKDEFIKLIKAKKLGSNGNVRMIYDPIKANDPNIYQSERWGNELKYIIPVDKPGKYSVVLKLAETYWNKKSSRVFDALIENVKVNNIDIYNSAGEDYIAFDTNIVVQVKDDKINIEFSAQKDNISICGIEIKDENDQIVTAINCGGKNYKSPNGVTYYNDEKFFERFNSQPFEVLAQEPFINDENKNIFLKITGNGKFYYFYYSIDEINWRIIKEQVDAKYLSTNVAGGFVGTILGMYASSNGEKSSNYADFDWFEYIGNDEIFENK